MLLLTLAGSIGPEKGMESLGCRLKPSSVLMTSRSRQSVTRIAQSGLGRLTRNNVLLRKVQRREAIARERAGGGGREVEEGLDSGRKGESRQQDDGGQGQEGEIAAEANAHARTPFGQQSLHCHCDNEGMTRHEYYRDGGGVNRGRALPAAAVLQAPSLRRVSASWVAIVRGRREPNEP